MWGHEEAKPSVGLTDAMFSIRPAHRQFPSHTRFDRL